MRAPDPIAFTLFGFAVRWYGILIGTGFLLAIGINYHRAPAFGIESERILDFALWMIPLSILGARLYYVFFCWGDYKTNLLSILDIRSGGLAIHGGLLAGLLTALFFCRKYAISFWNLADLCFPSVALAQAIGRWGNFFNAEAHGGPTDLPWAVLIDGERFHPTFLYESLWCLFLALILFYLSKKRKFRGQIALLYAILYSLERFFVEGLRTDSLMIGPFRQAQVLSLIIIGLSLILYHLFAKRKINR